MPISFKLKPFIISIFPLLFSFAANAQIDSLKHVIKTTRIDSNRALAFMHLGIHYERISLDSSFVLYDSAIAIARKNKFYQTQAKAHVNKSLAYLYSQNSKECFPEIKKSLPLYSKIKDWSNLFDAYYNLGFYFSSFEQFDSSVYYYQKALELEPEIKDNKRMARMLNNLGLMYEYQGKYDLAIDALLRSNNFQKAFNNPSVGINLLNIGLIYSKTGDQKEAILSYNEALNYLEGEENRDKKATTLKNIGDSKIELNQFDSAREYYEKSRALQLALQDSNKLSGIELSLFSLESNNNNWKKAKLHLDNSFNYFPHINGSKKLLMYLHSSKANLILNQLDSPQKKDALSALRSLNKAYEISKEVNLLDDQSKLAYKLNLVHSILNNYKKAHQFLTEHNELNDSLISKEKVKTIAQLKTQYNTEKKELEIEFLNKENQLQADNIAKNIELQQKQKTIIVVLIAGLIAIAIFLVIIFKLYREKIKSNRELAEKNDKILQQNKEKEVLLKEIHHRVKNNLQIISSLLDLQSRSIDNPLTKAAVNDGQNRVKSMALIHQLLYQNEGAGIIVFQDYLEKLISQIKTTQLDSRKIQTNISLPKDIEFDIDTAIPLGLIITELLTNAFKYAFQDRENGTISISLTQEDQKHYTLLVEDNGKGLPNNFDLKKAKSLGIRLVKTLSKQLKGNVTYHNQEGAKFILYFEGINPKEL